MAEHNELGKRGEAIALQYLIQKGYKIVVQNWRYLKDEIDIIARHNSMVVVVEVKTRSTHEYGEPEEAVSKKKRKYLVRAVDVFLQQRNIQEETRFDVISIIINGTQWELNHIEDAFYPTL